MDASNEPLFQLELDQSSSDEDLASVQKKTEETVSEPMDEPGESMCSHHNLCDLQLPNRGHMTMNLEKGLDKRGRSGSGARDIPSPSKSEPTGEEATDACKLMRSKSLKDVEELMSRMLDQTQFYFTTDVDLDTHDFMKQEDFKPLFDQLNLHLKNLRLLSLSHLDLKVLPENITFPVNLEVLYLTGNLLSSLPEKCMAGLGKKLKLLHLASNRFERFPKEISLLHQLETLDMTNNMLQDGEGIDFAHLEKLRTVVLLCNRLEKFPTSLLNAKSLVQLELANNRIRQIPPGIGQLREIKFLSVKCNRLTSLPEELAQLEAAEVICFSENMIVEVPVESLLRFKNFKLKTLCLHSNRIRSDKVMQLHDGFLGKVDVRLAENCIGENRRYTEIQAFFRKCRNMDKTTWKWDVYIAYAEPAAEQIVDEELVPKLHDMGLTTCVYYKDSQPGKNIRADRRDMIDRSKKILVLLAKDSSYSDIPFISEILQIVSETPKGEQTSHLQSNGDTARLIPVQWDGDAIIPKELNDVVINSRSTPTQEKHFWSRIEKALKS